MSLVFINGFLKFVSFFICIFFADFNRRNELIINCDVMEINNFYDTKGRPVFCQLIFWTQHYVPGGPNRIGFRARGFRMMGPDKNLVEKISGLESSIPLYYRYIAKDEQDQKCYIEVRAPVYKETWSQVDPEAVNRIKYRDWEDNYDLIANAIKIKNSKYVPLVLEEPKKEEFKLDTPK